MSPVEKTPAGNGTFTARFRTPSFLQILEVLRDFHQLFGPRNSPTTGILHTIRHVYKSEVKPRFGAALVRSAHDCESLILRAFLKALFLRFTSDFMVH